MRRLVIALSAVALAGCPPKVTAPTDTTLVGDGFKVRVAHEPFSFTVLDAAGAAKLATASGPRFTFDEHTYETQIIPGWDGYKSHERPWAEASAATLERSDDHSAVFTLHTETAAVTVTFEVSGAQLRYRQSIDDPRRFNKAALAFGLDADTHFFGLGQRTASVDHRGLSMYSWPEEGGLGGGESAGPSANNPYPNGPSMTYFPVPFFHTTRGVSALLDTTRRTEVHFGTDADAPDTWRLAADDTALELVFFVRDRPLDAIADYTALTGRPPVPAPWAFGPRRRVNRGGMVGGVPEWQAMRDRSLPLTTVDDAMHALPSVTQLGNEGVYRAWTQELHANGFKVMNYNNPYVSASAPNSAPDYAVGADAGYFEMAPDGSPATTFFLSGGAQTVSAIDLTNPAAVVWFKGLLKRSLDLGYDGWMHDFGEYTARSSRFADGRKGDEMHNAYPVLSAKAAFELLQAERPGDASFFARSGYTGSQAWLFENWGGDPEASFDNTEGLPAMLRGGLNLGMTGVPYWSSDIGGYKCITDAPHDKEMLVRWYEMAALSPMMHDEDACANPIGAGKTKATLWDDQQTQDIWRTSAGLHTRLAPYLRALAMEAHASGMPLTRHPVLLHPELPEAWAVEDSFFLGPSLYGAPVVRRGLTSRRVWLPPGRYVEWTERSVHTGPAFVDVPAPLDRLPLFLVENQLVPLLDASVQTLAPATLPAVPTEQKFAGVLDVIAVLGPGGTATLTLADGTRLTATRLDASAGNPQALGPLDDATFATCAHCGSVATGGATGRVRLVGDSAAASTVQLGDVRVTSENGPARRVRWEVLVL